MSITASGRATEPAPTGDGHAEKGHRKPGEKVGKGAFKSQSILQSILCSHTGNGRGQKVILRLKIIYF